MEITDIKKTQIGSNPSVQEEEDTASDNPDMASPVTPTTGQRKNPSPDDA